MHDDYKQLDVPAGAQIERCPVCGSVPQLWQYSTSPTAPTTKLVMCSRGDPIGPQDGLVNAGCLLYMPPDIFYRETIRDAVRYWNEFAKALTAMRSAAAPAFDATKPCLLTTADPTRTYCERCKNPHHACDTPPYGVTGAPAPAGRLAAWMHVQGNYCEPSLRPLDDDEKARGWTQFPLYTFGAEQGDIDVPSLAVEREATVERLMELVRTLPPPLARGHARRTPEGNRDHRPRHRRWRGNTSEGPAMSVAEGYSISVQCDGTHEPGLVPQGEVYGHTKREAHAELRRAGWRLGPGFTAYCKRCLVPRTACVPGRCNCSGIGHNGVSPTCPIHAGVQEVPNAG